MKMDHFKNYVCSFEGGGRRCFAGFLQLGQQGCSSLWRKGFSLRRPLAEQTLNPGSAAVLTWLSCSLACRVFPDEGSNPRPLCWQADAQPRDCKHTTPEKVKRMSFLLETPLLKSWLASAQRTPVTTFSVTCPHSSVPVWADQPKTGRGAWREIQDFSSLLLLNSLLAPSWRKRLLYLL